MKYSRLKEIRREKGITIIQMAMYLKMNPLKYQHIERNIAKMEASTFIQICKVLGIECQVI